MDRAKLIGELERDEAYRPRPYPDTKGKMTIGIGRNLTDNGITKEEAYFLCNNDIDNVEGDLDHNLPWWRNLNEARQRVLANMCFNMGIKKLLKFVHMLEHLKREEYTLAAVEMRASEWYGEVGVRAARLEAMMRTGGLNDPLVA